MSLFKEKLLEYLNECKKAKENPDYIKNRKLLDDYMNKLNDYLENYPNKEEIKDMIVDIMIINNRVYDVLRYSDFHTAFFTGLKVGRKSNNDQFDLLIDKINELIADDGGKNNE